MGLERYYTKDWITTGHQDIGLQLNAAAIWAAGSFQANGEGMYGFDFWAYVPAAADGQSASLAIYTDNGSGKPGAQVGDAVAYALEAPFDAYKQAYVQFTDEKNLTLGATYWLVAKGPSTSWFRYGYRQNVAAGPMNYTTNGGAAWNILTGFGVPLRAYFGGGAQESTDGDDTVICFYADGELEMLEEREAEVMLIGGGGGGSSGGGGAGGVVLETMTLAVGTYPVVIGQGGLGGAQGAANGSAGANTTFNGYTAYGGAGGGKQDVMPNSGDTTLDGPSGGGAGLSGSSLARYGGHAVRGTQGNAGGNNPSGYLAAAGGGGFVGAGQAPADSDHGGAGGTGFNSDIVQRGADVGYAGGGGGCAFFAGDTGGPATHGGGAGGDGMATPGSGTARTGGGGGGGGNGTPAGGEGGGGILVIRLAAPSSGGAVLTRVFPALVRTYPGLERVAPR